MKNGLYFLKTSLFQDEMENALASMRVDDVHIKRMGEAKNSLLEKRRNNPSASKKSGK